MELRGGWFQSLIYARKTDNLFSFNRFPQEAFLMSPSSEHLGKDQSGQQQSATLTSDDVSQIEQLCECHERLKRELGRVIVGQKEVIEQLAIVLFARGHGLLMGVPGLAKNITCEQIVGDALAWLQPSAVHSGPDADGYHRHGYSSGHARRTTRV